MLVVVVTELLPCHFLILNLHPPNPKTNPERRTRRHLLPHLRHNLLEDKFDGGGVGAADGGDGGVVEPLRLRHKCHHLLRPLSRFLRHDDWIFRADFQSIRLPELLVHNKDHLHALLDPLESILGQADLLGVAGSGHEMAEGWVLDGEVVDLAVLPDRLGGARPYLVY